MLSYIVIMDGREIWFIKTRLINFSMQHDYNNTL